MNDNLITQLIYRTVLCCVSLLAVLLTFGIFYAGSGPVPLTWEFLKYYTNISNYFVFGVSVAGFVHTVKRVQAGERGGYCTALRTLRFMTVVMILVTFLVYLILLGDPFSADFWRNIGNLSYHVVAPVLFIADYLIFEEKRTVSVFAPLYSLVIPLVYVVYIFILGAAVPGFTYPYFFLDVATLGYGGVCVWVLILLVVFTALGYLLWLWNRFGKFDGKWKCDFHNVLLRKQSPAAETPVEEEDAPSQKMP